MVMYGDKYCIYLVISKYVVFVFIPDKYCIYLAMSKHIVFVIIKVVVLIADSIVMASGSNRPPSASHSHTGEGSSRMGTVYFYF